MVHYWQHLFGKPSRSGYHNKEFAITMRAVGLEPSTTGQPGGKETGQNMSHYVVAGGRFEAAFLSLNAVKIGRWGAIKLEHETKVNTSKVKYTCPSCGLNVWAKPNINVLCAMCTEETQEWVLLVSAYLV